MPDLGLISYLDCILIATAVLMILLANKGYMSELRIAAGLLAVVLIGDYSYINYIFGPSDDSKMFHFPSFIYIAEFIHNANYFPDWFKVNGGIRTGYFQMNLGMLLPHRLIGYTIYSLFPIDPMAAYKITLAIGVWLNATGIAILVNRWLGSSVAACMAGLLAVFSGVAITTHQEQTIFTLMLAPWFILAVLEFSKNKLWLVVACGMIGLAATQHYPQIQVVSLISFFVIYMISRPRLFAKKILELKRVNFKIWLLSFFIFFLAFSSLPYALENLDKLSAPTRNVIVPSSIESYLHNNTLQGSSAEGSVMLQYINRDLSPFHVHPPDKMTFYIGLITIPVAVFGVLANIRIAAPVLILFGFLTLLTMGRHAPVPPFLNQDYVLEMLYNLSPWFFGPFRQWFHFVAMQQLSMVILFSIGIQAFTNRFVRHKSPFILVLLTIFLLLDLLSYRNHYIGNASVPYGNFPTYKQSNEIKFKMASEPPMRYKSREHLCATHNAAYITNNFIFKNDKSPWKLCDLQDEHGPSVAVFQSKVTNQLPPIGTKEDGVNSILSRKVLYDGLYYDVSVNKASTLVTEVNYDLGVKVTIDGHTSNAYIANGAFAAVTVPKGRHSVQVSVISDYYSYAAYLTILATIFIVALIIYLLNENIITNEPKRKNNLTRVN